MTREEALLKLLAIEPETRCRLIAVTGWQAQETESTLDALVKAGKVTYRNGRQGATGERLYYPRAETSGDVGALPASSGAGRDRVCAGSSGLVRADRALAFGWSWPPHSQGSGEETQ